MATYAPSASCGIPPIDGAGVELFAGYGPMSYCWRHFGFPYRGARRERHKHAATIRRSFPESVVILDANAVDAAALQPVSSSDDDSSNDEHKNCCVALALERPAVKVASVYTGASRANRSRRRTPSAASTTRALVTRLARCAARALDANSADAENHANIVTINGGAVLQQLTANFGPDYELVDISYSNVALYYAPEGCNRVALRWEHRRMRSALGACPPLFVMHHPRLRICDVLLPLEDVDPRAWVEGRLVHRARTAAPPRGAHIVADLHIDAATPIRVGSHVHYGGLGGVDFTVKTLCADGLTKTQR